MPPRSHLWPPMPLHPDVQRRTVSLESGGVTLPPPPPGRAGWGPGSASDPFRTQPGGLEALEGSHLHCDDPPRVSPHDYETPEGKGPWFKGLLDK